MDFAVKTKAYSSYDAHHFVWKASFLNQVAQKCCPSLVVALFCRDKCVVYEKTMNNSNGVGG